MVRLLENMEKPSQLWMHIWVLNFNNYTWIFNLLETHGGNHLDCGWKTWKPKHLFEATHQSPYNAAFNGLEMVAKWARMNGTRWRSGPTTATASQRSSSVSQVSHHLSWVCLKAFAMAKVADQNWRNKTTIRCIYVCTYVYIYMYIYICTVIK